MLYRSEKHPAGAIKLIVISLAALVLIICQMLFTVNAFAEETTDGTQNDENQIVGEQMQSDEIQKLEEEFGKYSGMDVNEIIAEYDPQSILKDAAKGNFQFSLKGFINRGCLYLFKEIYSNIDILIKLIVLVVLCAVLKNLQTSFLSESVGELAFFVCYIVLVSILIVSFNTALNLAKDILDNMIAFMQATVPVLLTLMVSGGNITTGGIFQPILITIVELSGTFMKNIFIPLIFLSTILSIVNNISDKVQVSKLAGLMKQISIWSLGIMLTLFIGVVSVQGSLGAVIDGVTSKTAKFAISTFIPIAGKYLADAADTVIGCTLLIKNGAGVAAMIGIIAICIAPLLKIFALILLFRITCALVEPISEKRITNCITEIANSLTFILGIVASVAFMFLISITAIISAGNISAMIR